MDASSEVVLVPLAAEGTSFEQRRGGDWVSLKHPNGVSGKRPSLEEMLELEVQPYERPPARAA